MIVFIVVAIIGGFVSIGLGVREWYIACHKDISDFPDELRQMIIQNDAYVLFFYAVTGVISITMGVIAGIMLGG